MATSGADSDGSESGNDIATFLISPTQSIRHDEQDNQERTHGDVNA